MKLYIEKEVEQKKYRLDAKLNTLYEMSMCAPDVQLSLKVVVEMVDKW